MCVLLWVRGKNRRKEEIAVTSCTNTHAHTRTRTHTRAHTHAHALLLFCLALQLLATGDLDYLKSLDQLKRCQERSIAFHDFEEAPINFMPTFKVCQRR